MQFCQQGDRAGLCVTQLDAKLVERGIVCAPGSVPTFSGRHRRCGAGQILQRQAALLRQGEKRHGCAACAAQRIEHLQPLPPNTYPDLLVFSNKPSITQSLNA